MTDNWQQDQLDAIQKTAAEQALLASGYVKKTMLGGFTTVRDVGSSDFIDVGLRNAIRAGIIPANLGRKPLDALEAGTSVNAELLGVAHRLGTLQPGKLADGDRDAGRSECRHTPDRARVLRYERRSDLPE